MAELTCKIRWVDKEGNPTPDQFPAIGHVYRVAHTEHVHGRELLMEESASYPICARHAEGLNQPGMEHWRFIPLEQEKLESAAGSKAS